MAQYFFRDPGNVEVLTPVIGKNSEAFKIGTPVTIDSSGFLAGCTSSGEKVYGICIEDKTCASDNQTVAQYKPLVVDAQDVIIAYSTSGTLAQTDVGEYADVATNSSGAITMGNPGATGQFLCTGINPDDTTMGYFRVAEPQQYAFAQS